MSTEGLVPVPSIHIDYVTMPSFHIPSTLNTTWVWWGQMVAVSIFNLILYVYVSRSVTPSSDPKVRKYQTSMRRLGFLYIFECAYRSVFPSIYNERTTLFDNMWNSILIARLLATVGEVAWIMQIGYALEEVAAGLTNGRGMFLRFVEIMSVLMVILSITGEINSCTGTFTTCALFEIYEAYCWNALFAIGSGLALMLYLKLPKIPEAAEARKFTGVLFLAGLFFCPYMTFCYTPRYVKIYNNEKAHHKHYLPLLDGIWDSFVHRVPTQKWSDWENDWFWMTCYFSFGVWSAIWLCYAPRYVPPSSNDSEISLNRVP